MNVYVINLDRSPERWHYMESMCAERGIVPQRVSAVDGRALSEEQLEHLSPKVDGVRWLATPEIACFESHKHVWRLIVEGEDSHGCVLEDDVILARGFDATCAAVVQELPDIDLVKLNSYDKPICVSNVPLRKVGPVKLYRPMQRTIDASAYLISRECAREALTSFSQYQLAVDNVLFDPDSERSIVQLAPAVAAQEKFAEFGFLSEAASESAIEAERAISRMADRGRREANTTSVRIRKELARFWRRRFMQKLQFLTNWFRPPEQRMHWRRILFADLLDWKPPHPGPKD